MDSTMFMGLFIGAILALLAGASIIAAIIVKPIVNLREDIVTLQNSINNTAEWKADVNKHLEKHDTSIDNLHKDMMDIRLDLTQCKASKPVAHASSRRKAS